MIKTSGATGWAVLVLVAAFGISNVHAEETSLVGAASYSRLSPGDRIIAGTLYAAQPEGRGATTQRWTLDRIAAARTEGRDWDVVFQEMKSSGGVAARDLAELLGSYTRPHVVMTSMDAAGEAAGDSVLTDGSNMLVRDQANGGSGAHTSFSSGVDAVADGVSVGQGGDVGGGHGHGRSR